MSFYDDASWLLVPSGIEEDVVFAQKPTSGLGDLTFTRASDATYTDSTGVVRRSPYNLVTWSEDFTNAAWIKQEVTISSNVAIAPNGTQSADKVTPSTLNTVHQIRMDSVVSASQCSFGVFAKADGYSTIEILDRISATDGAIFNLSNGTFTNKGGGIGKIENYGNGWYRCTVTANTTGIRIYVPSSGSSAGNGTSGIFIWGAQLVEGTSALDYFPTTDRLNVPRIDFRNADGTLSSCGRLLLEPQRTNSIRNSSMVGAVAGTPGTLPTNWTQNGGGGLTRTIVGIGTENGLPYIDLRLAGTATQVFSTIIFEGTIAASAGQAWSSSVYAKLISGTLPTSNLRILTSGSLTQDAVLNLTSSLNRYVSTYASLPAGTTTVQTYIQQTLVNGQTYDFTIRIAAPQMELGAYATTWVPTTTAAVTRLADTFTRNNIFTNGLISAAGGTWFVEFDNNVAYTGGITQAQLLGLGNNTVGATADNIFFACSSGTRLRVWKQIAGTLSSVYLTTTDKTKLAIKWNGTTMDVFENGVKVVTATSFTPTALETLRTIATQHPYNISQSLLAPTPLTDAQCIQLTTL